MSTSMSIEEKLDAILKSSHDITSSDGDPSIPFDLKNQIKLGKFILVI